jgi:hypothetical protein
MNGPYKLFEAAIIDNLMQGDNLDEPFIASSSGSWTKRQLVDEIKTGGKTGLDLMVGMMRLTMDLMKRGKEKLVEPKEEESQEELWEQIPKILFSLRGESMDDSEANLLQWLQKNYRIERISPPIK